MTMPSIRAIVGLWLLGLSYAQNRFYNIHDMPTTNFDCRDKILGGYYADPEVNCQMFHVCVKIPGQGVQDFRFLCPNETVFDQEQQICADSGDIDCASSGLFFENFDLYRLGSAQAAKPRPVFGVSKNTPIPLGPSTPSPLLSNSVSDDDDFYLQRSETGDRRSHSKDLLRGSSSSNLYNSRNGGKDLDDDDDDGPRNVNQTPQSYRPKPSQQSRGKSQYQTQFRRTDAPTSTTTVTTSTTTTPIPPRAPEDKKRTKVAVRKLARKRITTPEDVKSTSPTFTTQVTQKLSFGDITEDKQNSPISRSSSPQPPRQYQNFRARTEATTPAVPINYNQQNRGTTPAFNYQRVTTSGFEPSKNGPTTLFQSSPSIASFQNGPSSQVFPSTYRPVESSTPAFFEPSASPTPRPGGFNGRPIVASQTYQSPQPSFQTPQPQQFNRQPAQNRANNPQQFGSQNRQPNNQNRQQQHFNNRQAPSQQQYVNPNRPQNNNQQQVNNQNRQQQQGRQNNQQTVNFNPSTNQPSQQYQPNNNQQFNPSSPQPNVQFNQNRQQNNFSPSSPQPNVQFNQNRQQNNFNPSTSQPAHFNPSTPQFYQPNNQQPRVTPSPVPQTRAPANLPNIRAQTINAALQPSPSQAPYDDFEDQDKQEFLKTAPSSNFRSSDINSFAKNYNKENEKASQYTKGPSTQFYTPTVVTTPRPTQAPSTTPSTRPPVPSTTGRPQTPPATPARPQAPPAAPARPAAPASPSDDKNDYDYAYYDDGNTFSEYDSLDPLGEQDFSRTAKRAKSRLI